MFPNVTPKDPSESAQVVNEFNLWQIEETKSSDLTKSADEYWLQKLKSGEFPHLTKFFVALLPVMHTTAEVERLFSLVNVTKTHRRNKLKTETVEALMMIRKNVRKTKEIFAEFPQLLSKSLVTKLSKHNPTKKKKVSQIGESTTATKDENEADSETSNYSNESMVDLDAGSSSDSEIDAEQGL